MKIAFLALIANTVRVLNLKSTLFCVGFNTKILLFWVFELNLNIADKPKPRGYKNLSSISISK